jgi:hypothetical protein
VRSDEYAAEMENPGIGKRPEHSRRDRVGNVRATRTKHRTELLKLRLLGGFDRTSATLRFD